jgi:hypothetical protein
MSVVVSFSSTNTLGGSLHTFRPADAMKTYFGGSRNPLSAEMVAAEVPAASIIALMHTTTVHQVTDTATDRVGDIGAFTTTRRHWDAVWF